MMATSLGVRGWCGAGRGDKTGRRRAAARTRAYAEPLHLPVLHDLAVGRERAQHQRSRHEVGNDPACRRGRAGHAAVVGVVHAVVDVLAHGGGLGLSNWGVSARCAGVGCGLRAALEGVKPHTP